MEDRHYNVLFICTGNSARSIMAEVIMNHLGGGRFKAFSAGSHPRGAVHPATLRVLADRGYSQEGLRSKSWEEFAAPSAPKMDFIFTVCDQAAGEMCPSWPGQPITAHWGFADPTQVEGSEQEQSRAFWRLESDLVTRLRLFMDLPIKKLDRMSLQAELDRIGPTQANAQPGSKAKGTDAHPSLEVRSAVKALSALAHESRLSVFRLLVQAGANGCSAGQLAQELAIAPSSLSFHLKELSNAGLVNAEQQGRFVIYSANFKTMNALLMFLTENCCGGEPCLAPLTTCAPNAEPATAHTEE